MPPKRFEGGFGIPPSHPVESLLTSALYRLPDSVSPEYVENLTNEIVERVNAQLAIKPEADGPRVLNKEEIQTLHLKLARHFEDNGDSKQIDIPTCVDALLESPRFLRSDKGSMQKLFEIHQVKTMQRIAELRRKRALMTGDEAFNPYENLFETDNGEHYLARLLNMPHLEEESEYMFHCVGTSDSYINKMKRGEVEIFSFRDTKTHEPFVTVEYDCKSHRILQIKAELDEIPTLASPYAMDLIESLEKLSETVNDEGKKRTIESREVADLRALLTLQEKQKNNEVLTRDELLFLYEVQEPIQCFDGQRDPLIKSLISQRNLKEDIATICNCPPEHLAADFFDLNDDTQIVYEDTGKKITIIDFREEKHQNKLPLLVELAKNLKTSGSPARPDLAFEGGVISINLDSKTTEALKTRDTAKESYENADNHSPSYVGQRLKDMPLTPLEGSSLEAYIFSYNTDPETRRSSDAIVADMDKAGFRPATFTELIALGITHPELNKRHEYLVALGTKATLDGVPCVACLDWDGVVRVLARDGWTRVWDEHYRFVAVHK